MGRCGVNHAIPKDTLFYLKAVEWAGEGDVAVLERGFDQARERGVAIGELFTAKGLVLDVEFLFGPGHSGLA